MFLRHSWNLTFTKTGQMKVRTDGWTTWKHKASSTAIASADHSKGIYWYRCHFTDTGILICFYDSSPSFYFESRIKLKMFLSALGFTLEQLCSLGGRICVANLNVVTQFLLHAQVIVTLTTPSSLAHKSNSALTIPRPCARWHERKFLFSTLKSCAVDILPQRETRRQSERE